MTSNQSQDMQQTEILRQTCKRSNGAADVDKRQAAVYWCYRRLVDRSQQILPSTAYHNEKGVALLIALTAISFLVAVSVQLASSVDLEMTGSFLQAEEVRLDARIQSLANIGRTALLKDQTESEYDTFFDVWAGFDAEQLSELFGGEQSNLLIEDMSGRLQINALVLSEEQKIEQHTQRGKRLPGEKLQQPGKKSKKVDVEKLQRELWLRFLQLEDFGLEVDEAEALVDAISDWIDEDDTTRDKGAENGYYQGLEQPYAARNGPLQYVEELLLIKGMSGEILYGNEEHPGIIDYLTIYGSEGKININTAPLKVLQALHPDMNEDLAAEMDLYRKEQRNEELLGKTDWYKQTGTVPGDITFPPELLTVTSGIFALRMQAASAEYKKNVFAVVERQENTEQNILAWNVE